MGYVITNSQVYMIGISLSEPFELGFGSLKDLPRVIYTIKATNGTDTQEGVGEASIDFPFSNYDAWDIYWALSRLDLVGRDVDSREEILTDETIRATTLSSFPAAFAALNMALDDLFGKAHRTSVLEIYGQKRRGGKALASIGFTDDVELLFKKVEDTIWKGCIPKLKLGKGVEDDVLTLAVVGRHLQDNNTPHVLDFNAAYTSEDFGTMLCTLLEKAYYFGSVLFVEQPTKEDEGVAGLRTVKEFFSHRGLRVPVAADESFVRLHDALKCVRNDILLNFKIQKIGGLFEAIKVEQEIERLVDVKTYSTTVGGTFPTAIARAYDQQCAAVLRFANMPSDAWQPATEWFAGHRHLIFEDFPFSHQEKMFLPFHGNGLGVTPDWGKIQQFIILDPAEEYRKIRQGSNGSRIAIRLSQPSKYADHYELLSGKKWNWNL